MSQKKLYDVFGLMVAAMFVLTACQGAAPVPTSTAAPAPTAALSPIPTMITVTPTPDVVRIVRFDLVQIDSERYGVEVITTGRGGVGLTIRVSYNTSPKGGDTGEWVVIKELGVPAFQDGTPNAPGVNWPVWDTEDLQPGTYLVRADVKTSDDPNWTHPTVKYLSFVKK